MNISPALEADLEAKGADLRRTFEVIDILKKTAAAPRSVRIPDASDRRIVDLSGNAEVTLSRAEAMERLGSLGVPASALDCGEATADGKITLGAECLRKIGVLLYPVTAYGVLNGGSATSYLDEKKNRELNPAAFEVLRTEFERAAAGGRDVPKGITPAFLSADGKKGPSFLELKMRSLLLKAGEYREATGDRKTPVLPFFQMTSRSTDGKLKDAYAAYRRSPVLAPLIDRHGIDPTDALGEVQPLLAALTHAEEGMPRGIFSRAWGKADTGLVLPGGHGENFRVLAKVYAELRMRGVRYAYLGNVDNSGYTVDPVALAVTALAGAQGAFEFAWKTPVDVKGGVLVELDSGRLGVADIGQAISKAEVAQAEAAGKPILFNCATGLFDLDYLVPRLESLADGLPIRVSDQDKEAGRYAQAEQNTWDIVGLMEKPLIFAVAKERRFLPAKMLIETLLASPAGARIDDAPEVDGAIKDTARRLRSSLSSLLESEYGLDA